MKKEISLKMLCAFVAGLTLFVLLGAVAIPDSPLQNFRKGIMADFFYKIDGAFGFYTQDAADSIAQTKAATNANTASTIVKRDSSGNFSAGTITADLTGNASGSAGSCTGNAATSTVAGTVTTANEATDTTCFPLFATDATGSLAPKTNANLTYNSSNGNLSTSTSGAVLSAGATNKLYFKGDYGGSGEIPAGVYGGSYVGGYTIIAGAGTAGTSPVGISYYTGTGTTWYSALSVSNVASGYGALKLMKSGGNVGIGLGANDPAAKIHVAAGSATANTAPLKINSGTLLTAPEAGAIEYDGTNFYVTNSTPTRTAIGTMNNPMTTAEDLIVGGASGAPARLAKGADGKALMMVSGAVAWDTPAGGGDVVAPASTTENKVPFWSSVSKTLSDGWATAITAIANTLVLRDANANITAARFYGEEDSPKSDYQLANKKYVDDNAGGLPSQTGNNGKYLTTDGTTASWGTVSGGVTTTSLFGAATTALSVNSFYANMSASIAYQGNLPASATDGQVIEILNTANAGSNYPPAQNATYVKSTSDRNSSFYVYFCTDPTKTLTGDYTGNSWAASASGSQRIHIDLGSAILVNKIYYENIHDTGTVTDIGAKNFTFWGSNSATAFADTTYATDTDWTQIGGSLQFDQHAAANTVDPKYITVVNTSAYRYYAVKIADNWGYSGLIGIRRLVLQSALTLTINPDDADTIKRWTNAAGDSILLSELGQYIKLRSDGNHNWWPVGLVGTTPTDGN